MLIGIFVESNEDLGLMYKSYKDIPKIVEKFMNFIHSTIDYALNKGIPKDDINDKLKEFKSNVKLNMIKPQEVDIKDLHKMIDKIKSCKGDVNVLLCDLGKIRKKFRFGNNIVHGIIIKPKIYRNSIDENELADVNKYMLNASKSLDWIEKVILDLMNMCDQDLNLASVMNRVYFRECHETSDFMEELNDEFLLYSDPLNESINNDTSSLDSFIDRFNKLLTEQGGGIDDNIIKESLVNKELFGVVNNIKYYPLFIIGISYDYNDKFGKIIHAVTNGDEYTHGLLAFDSDLEHIVQFQMNGIERGNINTYEAVKHTKSVYVAVHFLTEEEMKDVQDSIDRYESLDKNTKYDIFNFVTMVLGKASRADMRHVCSTFVGYILNVVNKKNLTKDYSEFRPGDVTILPRSYFVMTFKNLEDFKNRKDEFKIKVKKIYDNNIDDIIEYNNSIPKVMLTNNLKKSGKIRDFFSKLMFGK